MCSARPSHHFLRCMPLAQGRLPGREDNRTRKPLAQWKPSQSIGSGDPVLNVQPPSADPVVEDATSCASRAPMDERLSLQHTFGFLLR